MSVYQGSDAGGDGTGKEGASSSPAPLPGIANPVPAPDLSAPHQAWLLAQQGTLPNVLLDQWRSDAAWNADITKFNLTHYNCFDHGGPQILWRFTSKPKTEFIQITAGAPLELIISVIAAHSGGADKSNQDVKTSSLCRNPGALLGTAASIGGDKKVLNIINKAEYLFGIDVSTLAARGVSAHPALSRTISVIETEYVLVPTPGLPPYSLDELATCKYPNPFKGRIFPNGTIAASKVTLPIGDPQGGYAKLFTQPSIAPDSVTPTGKMDDALAEAILKFAARVSPAASKQPGVIQMKEGADLMIMIKIAGMVFGS